MAVVVVDEEGGGVVVFGGEAEGVFGEEVAVGDAGGAGGAGDGAEGGVVVVGGDAVLRGVVEDLGDVLVAVMSVKEIEVPILGTHDKRSCGDGHAVEGHRDDRVAHVQNHLNAIFRTYSLKGLATHEACLRLS